MTMTRAPAIAQKLEAARSVRASIDPEIAQAALEAAEGARGADKRLADLRARVAMADREVAELEKAHALAARLDRQAAVQAVAEMRAEQLADFKVNMEQREKAMAKVMEAAALMAKAYAEYSEATLAAQIAMPTGTSIPVMAVGPDGVYGPVFGPCERLILSELWRLAPPRSDGIGRFFVPFAKPTVELFRRQPEAMPAGIDELRSANQAIVIDVEKQVAKMNESAMAAASKEAA
ncbi:hypothetical protein [Bradyrhizobium neotropicale]|uniref:Uncharacterized protein n=1 Tax=Bradyrhizobium neotropicale TaxID=1497615 RepID=A0A176ZD55_9BRAD|nr:hypothetical protein [Bradyrhizobium neotropicale]OAF17852.1 hypothetical protein AXW67_06950 [Bradyrhizobium neotropicale]